MNKCIWRKLELNLIGEISDWAARPGINFERLIFVRKLDHVNWIQVRDLVVVVSYFEWLLVQGVAWMEHIHVIFSFRKIECDVSIRGPFANAFFVNENWCMLNTNVVFIENRALDLVPLGCTRILGTSSVLLKKYLTIAFWENWLRLFLWEKDQQ